MKSKLVRIMKVLLTTALVGAMTVAPVMADSAGALRGEPVTTDATIDTSKKGSISIVKLFDATGLFVEANGQKKDWANSPLGGVEFSRIKIADIKTVNEKDAQTGAVTVGVYYQLTGGAQAASNFKNFVQSLGGTLTPDTTVSGVEYYKPETLENALKAINANQTSVENWVKTNGAVLGGRKTNDAGIVSEDELDLGLYLIAETDDSTAYINGNNVRTGDDFVANETDEYKASQTEVNNKEANSTQRQNATQEYNGEMFDRTQGVNRENEPATTAVANDNTTQVVENLTIASKIQPYLISVPMTQVDVDTNGNTTLVGGGNENDTITSDGAVETKWMYDIVSYPKNSEVEITKKLIDPDAKDGSDEAGHTLRDQDDFEIGETVKQVIFTSASPLREGKLHEKYIITDKMSKGLNLLKDASDASKYQVTIKYQDGTKIVNPTTDKDLQALSNSFTYGTDFTVAYDGYDAGKETSDRVMTITFTAAGLAKLDALTQDTTIAVFFNCVARSESSIGTATPFNMNQPSLTWQNSNEYTYENGSRTPTDHEIVGNRVYDFTYEIDLTKTGLDKPSRSQFEVYKTTTNTQVDKTEGNTIADNAPYADASKLGDIVKWIKESDGVYHVFDNDDDVEANAVTYVSPADADGKLLLKGFDSEIYRFREIQTENGKNLLKTTFDVDIDAQDPGRNGQCTATLTSDGVTTQLPAENGIISFTVDNFKGVVLHTGGAGRGMIYGIGACLGAFLVAVSVVRKKRQAVA